MTTRQRVPIEVSPAQRILVLKDVLETLRQERSRMEDEDRYITANVFGMNQAVDKVIGMLPQPQQDIQWRKEHTIYARHEGMSNAIDHG